MENAIITERQITEFCTYMSREEKSQATIEKYSRDVRALYEYCRNTELKKDILIQYKEKLIADGYAVRSINSMLAAINSFLSFLGRQDLKVKTLRLQRQVFCPAEKELTREEYECLCRTAEKRGKKRIGLILQTICGTGIRVSELQFITVKAAQNGEVCVSCKGKTRMVFIVRELQKKLLRYAAEQQIVSGPIFVTRTGKAIDRTNIWREMKQLCINAGVSPQKVFPHNLRHLFAKVFYQKEKDIAKLADILGHNNINTTRIYIISSGAEHRQRMEQMHLII